MCVFFEIIREAETSDWWRLTCAPSDQDGMQSDVAKEVALLPKTTHDGVPFSRVFYRVASHGLQNARRCFSQRHKPVRMLLDARYYADGSHRQFWDHFHPRPGPVSAKESGRRSLRHVMKIISLSRMKSWWNDEIMFGLIKMLTLALLFWYSERK